jgi:hypothetical protein
LVPRYYRKRQESVRGAEIGHVTPTPTPVTDSGIYHTHTTCLDYKLGIGKFGSTEGIEFGVKKQGNIGNVSPASSSTATRSRRRTAPS